MAAAHPTERPDPDPCAKNFKIPKIVAVADDTMFQQELESACELMRGVCLDVETAKPPAYSDQGQTRGRKPKRSKLEKAKKLSKNAKAKKNGKGGKGKGKGKKRNAKTKVLKADGKTNAHSAEALAPTPGIKKRKVAKSKQDVPLEGDTAAVAEPAGPAKRPRKKNPKADEAELPVAPKRKATKPVATPARNAAMLEHGDQDVEPASSSAAPVPAAPVPLGAEVSPAEAAPEAAPAGDRMDNLEDCSKPADAIDAPPHVTTNGVYSSAYRRAKAATGDTEKAKHVA